MSKALPPLYPAQIEEIWQLSFAGHGPRAIARMMGAKLQEINEVLNANNGSIKP